jgi:hypothetical protein
MDDSEDWDDADDLDEAEVLDTTNDALPPMHGKSGTISISVDRAGGKGKGSKGAGANKGPSKHERLLHLYVHRSHVLCILSRTHQLDCHISSDPQLQSTMLSLLDGEMLEAFDRAIGPQGSAFRFLNCLKALTGWFRQEFTVLHPDTSYSIRRSDATMVGSKAALWQMGRDALAMRAGEEEVLVALFVGLLRALGLSCRIVRVMDDALSYEPWKKKNMLMHMPPFSGHKRTSLPAASNNTSKKSRAPDSEPISHIIKNFPPSSSSRDCDDMEPAVKRRKGDEELEQQIAMAILSTGAEAAARNTAAAAGTSSSSTPLPPTRTSLSRGKGGHMRGGASGSRAREVIHLESERGGGQEDQRNTSSIPLIWAEVACGPSMEARWMHVDAVRGRVDEPSSVLPAVKGAGKARRSYMMASEAPSQSIMDVSARYLAAAASSLVAAKKGEGKWWEETIEIFDQCLTKSGPQESKSQPNDASTFSPINVQNPMHGAYRDQREKEELKKMAEDQLRKQVPTSIDGFKSHPFFVLKRHIQKYEAMKPGSKMQGMFKGEVYYDRSELFPLHTADRWRREGREVMADELKKPYKLAAKRKVPQTQPAASQMYGRGGYQMYGPKKGGVTAGSSSAVVREDLPSADAHEVPCDNVMEEEEGVKASEASSMDTDEPQTLLYGLWQTCEWKPPVARDGIVPKNERGSVECPPLMKSLPQGTVHLNQYPNLQPVCRALGVDFGPALVGWEVSGGRMLPRFEGVVICSEFEAQVVNACLEREVAKNEAIRQKAERVAKQGWHKLVEAMRTRTRLDANYKGQPQALTAREVLTIDDTSDEEMEVYEDSSNRKGAVDEERDAVTKRLKEDYAKSRVGEDPESRGEHGENLNRIEREEI